MMKRISAGRLAPVAVGTALLVLAGGAVVAVDAQTQDEQAAVERELAAEIEAASRHARAAQEEIEAAYRAAIEAARAASEEALVEGRSRLEASLAGAQEALVLSQEEGRRHARELRERLVRAPRIEIRDLHGRFWGGGMVDRVLAMAEDLELTEAQEDQIRAARRAYRRDEIERDAQIEVAELDLDELLENRHTADLAAVEQVMQRRADLRVQGELAGLRLSQEVWNVLTAEQRETLDEHRGRGFVIRGGPKALYFGGEGDFEFFGDDEFFGGERFFEKLEPFFFRHEGPHENEWHFEHEEDDGDEDDEGGSAGVAIGVSRASGTIAGVDL